MQLTKRNHDTPCFWAALWSETYYRSFLAGALEAESVRDQPIHALNVKSGRLFETTVENVHFDKNLCVAEITRESAEDFAKRHHPDEFEEFLRARFSRVFRCPATPALPRNNEFDDPVTRGVRPSQV